VSQADPAIAAMTTPPTARPTGLPVGCSLEAGAPATAGRSDSPGSAAAVPLLVVDDETEGLAVAVVDAAVAPVVGRPAALEVTALDDDGAGVERALGAPGVDVALGARVLVAVGVGAGSATTGAHSLRG
jgi:hypothetical protein